MVELAEDELHRLVLVNHVHSHVAVVPLRTHQRGPEHNADVLRGHSVGVRMLQHSARTHTEKQRLGIIGKGRQFFFVTQLMEPCNEAGLQRFSL